MWSLYYREYIVGFILGLCHKEQCYVYLRLCNDQEELKLLQVIHCLKLREKF